MRAQQGNAVSSFRHVRFSSAGGSSRPPGGLSGSAHEDKISSSLENASPQRVFRCGRAWGLTRTKSRGCLVGETGRNATAPVPLVDANLHLLTGYSFANRLRLCWIFLLDLLQIRRKYELASH